MSEMLKRSGLVLYAKAPPNICYLEIVDKRKIVAFTLRGAFWCRPGKNPRRIAAPCRNSPALGQTTNQGRE